MPAGPIGNDLDQCVAQEPSEESVRGNLHRGLPFFGIVFCLGQFSDVLRGVAERDDLATSGKHDRIEKPSSQDTNSAPAHITRTYPRPSVSTSRRHLTDVIPASRRQPPDASPRRIR
jgi:hypothetical protein